jgi:hypothetical protein
MKASVVEHATARRRARDLYTPDIELTLAKANLGSFNGPDLLFDCPQTKPHEKN